MKHVVLTLAALAFAVSAQADEFTLTTEDVIEVTSEQPTPKPIEPELDFMPEQVACYVWDQREGAFCRPR